MLQLLIPLHLLLARSTGRLRTPRRRFGGDAGQSTAEYALVLLGAASVALLLVAWATGTDRIGNLLDSVVDQVMDHIK
jgi:hypothetical protein